MIAVKSPFAVPKPPPRQLFGGKKRKPCQGPWNKFVLAVKNGACYTPALVV